MALARIKEHRDRRGRALEIWAPAKLNLHLEVIGKRNDGFHEIETVMVPVDLYDTLYFRDEADQRQEITCPCEPAFGYRATGSDGNDWLPAGADNLVVRAVELVRRRATVRRGVRLRLVKRIPIAAGLAGGSSDAAAALVAADRWFETNLGRATLTELAEQLGSDVPFFLGSGAALATGRGETLEALGPVPPLDCVIVRPRQGLSTAKVFAASQAGQGRRDAAPLVEALIAGQRPRVGALLFNRLQSAARRLSPWIDRLDREMRGLDLWGHQMSGSGTSCFALCRHARHARRIAAFLNGRGVGAAYAVKACCLSNSN